MASTLQQLLPLLPRSIRPMTVLESNGDSNDADPTPQSPRPKKKKESRMRRLSRRGSSAQRVVQDQDNNNNKKKKKSRLSSLTCSFGGHHHHSHDNDNDALVERPPLLQIVVPITALPAASPLLHWLQHSNNCNSGALLDLVPKILAFCGPKTTLALHQSNRFWHAMTTSEAFWKVQCEELYKWREGDDEPESWRDFYRMNPAVPTDYGSVAHALAAVAPPAAAMPRKPDQHRNSGEEGEDEQKLPSRTIWLRPQEHRLHESLVVQAVEANITLETMRTTMDHPNNNNDNNDSTMTHGSSSIKKRRQRQPLASLLLQTRRRNKPLLHIAAGQVTLRRLRLGHYCGGFNLWNGNSAIQIQPLTPALTDADQEQRPTPDRSRLPTATLIEVEVISHSGRGVVINDGGNMDISHSYIHDCAATGIYVGSNDCHLTLTHSDLIANGHGNQLAASVRASGVSKGHSGFYLENGHATLTECNITNNSSCGISVSSMDSRLTLSHSDVVANGHSNQVEVAFGGLSEQNNWNVMGGGNNVAKTGLVKVRSLLGLQSCLNGGNGNSPVAGRSSRNSSGTIRPVSMTRNRAESEDSVPAAVIEDDDEDDMDDLEHLQDSFVVAEENVRFGEMVEI